MPSNIPLKNRKYDLVLFGATGFTGQLISKHLSQSALPHDFSWAIAGRSASKLEKLYDSLEEAAEDRGTSEDARNLPKILDFETHSPQSIIADTRVVVSVIGPYTLHGEQFLKVCVEEGTAWVDLAGEMPWYREMVQKYEKKAKETGAIIVPSCGLDCIPSDFGAFVLAKHMGGNAGKVQAVFEGIKTRPSSGSINSVLSQYRKYDYEADIIGPTGFMKDPYYVSAPSLDTSGLPKQRSDPEVIPVEPVTFYAGKGDSGKLERITSGYLATTGVVEGINRNVVMRTVALQTINKPPSKNGIPTYGSKFDYREYLLNPSNFLGSLLPRLIARFASTTILWIFSFSVIQRAAVFLIDKLLGSNSGPSEKTQEEGYFRVRMLGEANPERNGRRPYAMLQCFKDPGYAWTSMIVSEFGVYLALKIKGEEVHNENSGLLEGYEDNEGDMVFTGTEGPLTKGKGGFWTPASFGVGAVRWISRRGDMDVETGWV